MFGYEHNLMYRSERTYKTCLGGFLSFVTICISAFAFIFFGREMFQKNNPIIVSSEKPVIESRVSLKKLGLFFALADSDGTYLHLNPEFIKSLQITPMMLNFNAVNGIANLKLDYLFVEPCQSSFFDDEVFTILMQSYDITKGLCINPNKAFIDGKIVTEEQFFYNEWSQVGSRSLWLNMRLCDERAKPECRAWINDNKDFFFVTNFVDYYYDGSDYKAPVKNRLKTTNTIVGTGLAALMYNQIINKKATLDSGVMFQDLEEIEYTSNYENTLQFQTFDENNPNIFDLMFSSPKTKIETSRRYAKLQELIADVGGFLKAVMMVLGYVGKVIGEYMFYTEFSGDIEYKRKKSERISLRISKIGQNENQRFQRSSDEVVINRSELQNKEEEKKENPENIAKSSINLKSESQVSKQVSFCVYFLTTFSKNFGLKRGLNKAETFKYFDINFIAKKLTDLERLVSINRDEN